MNTMAAAEAAVAAAPVLAVLAGLCHRSPAAVAQPRSRCCLGRCHKAAGRGPWGTRPGSHRTLEAQRRAALLQPCSPTSRLLLAVARGARRCHRCCGLCLAAARRPARRGGPACRRSSSSSSCSCCASSGGAAATAAGLGGRRRRHHRWRRAVPRGRQRHSSATPTAHRHKCREQAGLPPGSGRTSRSSRSGRASHGIRWKSRQQMRAMAGMVRPRRLLLPIQRRRRDRRGRCRGPRPRHPEERSRRRSQWRPDPSRLRCQRWHQGLAADHPQLAAQAWLRRCLSARALRLRLVPWTPRQLGPC